MSLNSPTPASEPTEPAQPTRRPMRLGSGQALQLEQALRETKKRPSRLIVLAGPVGSGKTTIITCIYDSFQKGPFAGFLFAGSETLVALEERCHEGRTNSGLEVPTTARTRRSQIGDLLHVAISREHAPLLSSLLVNDVSGEVFDEIADRPSNARDLLVLAEADRIAIILDGDSITDRSERDAFAYRTEMLARSISEYGNLKAGATMDAVVTKLDIVKERKEHPRASAYAKAVLQSVPEDRRGQVLMTCARSSNSRVSSGQGIGKLLDLWMGGPAERQLGARTPGSPSSKDA